MRSNVLAVLLPVLLLGAFGCATTEQKAASSVPPAATGEASGDQIGELRLSEFTLGAGDKLEIVVYRHEDLRRSMSVDLSGKIMFPLIGDLQAAGKSVFALRDEMTQKLSRYIVRPEVSISVTAVLSRRVMVLGEVHFPGAFVLETELAALDMISKAGGTTNDANLEKVLLIRSDGDKKTETYLDLDKALTGKDYTSNVTIRSGDILFVPPTRMANFGRVASSLSSLLSPIVSLEGAIVLWPLVKNVLSGDNQNNSQVTIPTSK